MEVVCAAVTKGESQLDGGMCGRYAAVGDGLGEGDDFVGTEPGRCDAGVVEVCYWCGEGLEGWGKGGGIWWWSCGWVRRNVDYLVTCETC